MRLLLAEDEQDLSKALCAILKHNNYSVDAVYDGQDALDYGLSENYDGIILDIMMPKKNGITAGRIISLSSGKMDSSTEVIPSASSQCEPWILSF